jgi:hypothetical protein
MSHDMTTCDRCYEFDIWINRSASPTLRKFLTQLKAEHVVLALADPTHTFSAKPVSVRITPVKDSVTS